MRITFHSKANHCKVSLAGDFNGPLEELVLSENLCSGLNSALHTKDCSCSRMKMQFISLLQENDADGIHKIEKKFSLPGVEQVISF